MNYRYVDVDLSNLLVFSRHGESGRGLPGSSCFVRACSRGLLYGQDLFAFGHGTPGGSVEKRSGQGLHQGNYTVTRPWISLEHDSMGRGGLAVIDHYVHRR